MAGSPTSIYSIVYETLTPPPFFACSAFTTKGLLSFLTSILAARVLVSFVLATQIRKLALKPLETGPIVLSKESAVIFEKDLSSPFSSV